MARFVETFKDWIVSFPNRYKIIEDGQEKTVEIERDWEPDVEGTSNNERVMNELVKNITYDTDTVHTTESGTSVYICDLVGMKEFAEYSSSDSSFIPKISAQINTTNSNQLSKIRISGKDGSVSDYDLYTINNGVYSLLGANKLKPNTIVIIKIVSNGANKIAVVQYLMDDKLDKGTYPGNASDLKSEIDKKASKTTLGRIIVGDNLTVDSNGRMSGNPAVDISGKLDKGTYSGNAGDLKSEIDKIASTTQLGRIKVGDNLTINKDGILSGHPFPNYKGIYSEGTSYAIGDVVNVTGHEPCYVFETTLCEMSDPQHPKYFRKVYRIEDTMYYVKEKDGFEILFTKEEKIPFYTIPQKGEQQNYKSTIDDYFPYSDIRGVVFNGFVGTTIAQILDKNDATKQSNGSPSNLTTLGNVMNEYPKFYCQVKMTPQGRRYRIFSYKNPTKKIAMGIKPHPVFKKPDGSYKNFEYLGRYEGSHDGTRVVSLSGKSPYVNITQGTIRDKCRAGRNTNWNMLTFEQVSMLQCLYIVEFGDLNSQSVLGQGRANTSSASATGTCDALGMRSGRISNDDANGNVCYRGLEDFYGNIWDIIDGFMISDNGYHYTNDPSKFGNLSAMTLFPKTLNFKISEGYADKMEVIDGYEHLLIPYGTTGSTTTYYCDKFWSHDKGEENTALFGGYWLNGASCGCFCLSCVDIASTSGGGAGGRLSVFV